MISFILRLVGGGGGGGGGGAPVSSVAMCGSIAYHGIVLIYFANHEADATSDALARSSLVASFAFLSLSSFLFLFLLLT